MRMCALVFLDILCPIHSPRMIHYIQKNNVQSVDKFPLSDVIVIARRQIFTKFSRVAIVLKIGQIIW